MQQLPTVRVLKRGEAPSSGFVRRKLPVFPEFAERMTWFTRQEWERNGDPEMVYLWVLREENKDYEKSVRRQRYCQSYRGHVIVRNAHAG